MTVVARLVEREYRTAGAAQAQLNQLTSDLLHTTVIFAGAACCWRCCSPSSPCAWCRG
jgi:hypothetical protein